MTFFLKLTQMMALFNITKNSNKIYDQIFRKAFVMRKNAKIMAFFTRSFFVEV